MQLTDPPPMSAEKENLVTMRLQTSLCWSGVVMNAKNYI